MGINAEAMKPTGKFCLCVFLNLENGSTSTSKWLPNMQVHYDMWISLGYEMPTRLLKGSSGCVCGDGWYVDLPTEREIHVLDVVEHT